MSIYWRPRGGPLRVQLPWWLPLVGPPTPEALAGPGPIEVVPTVVVLAVYLHVGMTRALWYVGLGLQRGIGAIRNVVRLAERPEPV